MNGRFVAAIICVLLSVGNGAAADSLRDAAKAGDVMQIKILLSQGADINGGSGLAPPLFYAIQNRHEQAALALIKLGADVNATSIWGTPLHAAAAANMPMAAAWLIGYGADPECPLRPLPTFLKPPSWVPRFGSDKGGTRGDPTEPQTGAGRCPHWS